MRVGEVQGRLPAKWYDFCLSNEIRIRFIGSELYGGNYKLALENIGKGSL